MWNKVELTNSDDYSRPIDDPIDWCTRRCCGEASKGWRSFSLSFIHYGYVRSAFVALPEFVDVVGGVDLSYDGRYEVSYSCWTERVAGACC